MTLHNYIKRRSHDDVEFAEVPSDILLDVVACLGSHGNYSPCQMDFVCNGIANSLMEQ